MKNFKDFTKFIGGVDKIYHFIAGALVYIIVLVLIPFWWLPITSVVIAAFGKELYDKYVRKCPSADWDLDIGYTIFGGLAVELIRGFVSIGGA
jgi:hypothetical protein